ncbi:MAG: alpha/beta hydrolase [Bacilli bacterium]|nr:alpha/beta hydrolase [Bacilli bacterium]
MARKYPISKEFFPFSSFTAPTSRFVLFLSQKTQGVPRFFRKNKESSTTRIKIKGYKGEELSLYVLTPNSIRETANRPALIFIHGGGFVFEAYRSHYQIALKYALECDCVLVYVKYNLAPKYPFPYPQEEGYKALEYVFEHAKELGIDTSRIGITGDSAGATIAVSSMLNAIHQNKDYRPLFQLLIYPWLDKRGDSESNRKYTDTPMWNSSLSAKSHKLTDPKGLEYPTYINSPVENGDIGLLPPAYIEVAEFDCLHDDGVLFHRLLKEKGVESTLYETKGTMHGYDSKFKAPTTQRMIAKRIEFIKAQFAKK